MNEGNTVGGGMGGKSQVLLMDGSDRSRGLLTDGLRGQGFEVMSAPDERRALEVFRQRSFDAVVLAFDSPSTDKTRIIPEFFEHAEDTVVILLTEELDVTSAVRAMRAGVFDILQQPVRCLELSTRLQEGLRAMDKRDTVVSWGPPAPASSGRFKTVQTRRVLGTRRLIGDSDGMKRVRDQIENLARFRDVPVLIVGETGTGKEVVAAAIHDLTAPGEDFVSVNCAAIPELLFENELFGHAAGAFTGSTGERAGLFEDVGEGTFFLDEVAEMPASLQPKLLRVLQTRKFRRVGGHVELDLRARIVSATNRSVSASDQDGMRSDLYFRLAGLAIHLPPLRKRIGDVPLLATHFLSEFAKKYPGVPVQLAPAAVEKLKAHLWPGNVRELQAVVEQAAMISSTSELTLRSVEHVLHDRMTTPGASSIPPGALADYHAVSFATEDGSNVDDWAPQTRVSSTRFAEPGPGIVDGSAPGEPLELNEIERQVTIRAFYRNGRNLSKTARALSIPRTTLRDRLKRYGEC